MKKDIHPEYIETQVTCTCGNSFTTRSTAKSGQINAEVAAGCYVGAVGGAVDFLRGAARSKGGLPIVALPATAKGGVRLAKSEEEVGLAAAEMLGNTLVTIQTGDAGKQVNRLYVTDDLTEAVEYVKRESARVRPVTPEQPE